jgi:hypothetical protein
VSHSVSISTPFCDPPRSVSIEQKVWSNRHTISDLFLFVARKDYLGALLGTPFKIEGTPTLARCTQRLRQHGSPHALTDGTRAPFACLMSSVTSRHDFRRDASRVRPSPRRAGWDGWMWHQLSADTTFHWLLHNTPLSIASTSPKPAQLTCICIALVCICIYLSKRYDQEKETI